MFYLGEISDRAMEENNKDRERYIVKKELWIQRWLEDHTNQRYARQKLRCAIRAWDKLQRKGKR